MEPGMTRGGRAQLPAIRRATASRTSVERQPGGCWRGATRAPRHDPAVRLEAPPTDELKLVVLVLSTRGARAGGVHVAEVGLREVPAAGEGEGPRRPPHADFGLPVVDAKEVR